MASSLLLVHACEACRVGTDRLGSTGIVPKIAPWLSAVHQRVPMRKNLNARMGRLPNPRQEQNTMAITNLWTSEDLLAMGDDFHYELFRGELRPLMTTKPKYGRV